jgi:hypothetical protein
MPFIRNCATLGIGATTLRIVDPVQFRARVDEFDFDITVQRFSFSTTPGDSFRRYRRASDRNGSPIGTSSAGHRRSLVLLAAYRRPGGTTATKPQKSTDLDKHTSALNGCSIDYRSRPMLRCADYTSYNCDDRRWLRD